jgi:chorismate mutase
VIRRERRGGRFAAANIRRPRRLNMTLNDHRRRVDELDRELVRLLNRRAQMSIQLGELKRGVGLALRDDAREREIVERALRSNPGPLDPQALEAIFQRILEESRRVTEEILAQSAESATEKAAR